ncbi:uncharacterized protein C5L36_0D03090 [Pichia kudriavzevii]|uniref:Conserved oligomeric Golgi complex subunit 6 n=1 Tax=Pichia kudriavzevii TaxID=4909 RepID=A0A2U9R842_PICKU|nr:uncharacterized protein C5L36_0D03090 [Pichia kudriavzevii]AWU77574.1 hypothetical protein C5L36_0D03090 [Pichia kudriavzevii]
MDFAYEVDTYDNSTLQGTNNKYVTGKTNILSSISTTDFTKKLQSLSILDIGRTPKNMKQDTDTNTSKSLERARTSIELLNTLGLDHIPLYNNEAKEWDDYNQFFIESNLDGKDLISKLNRLLEGTDGSDLSTRTSLELLQKRVDYEISLKDSSANEMKSLTSADQESSLARRNLRGLIESDLVQQYAQQLRPFTKVVKSIESFKPTVEAIINDYNGILDSLVGAINDTDSLKSKICGYEKEKELVDMKKNLLLAFKNTYTISQYEEYLIRFGDLNDPIAGTEFFEVIGRVTKIISDCDVLLGMENETIGLTIMKKMNEYLSSINEKVQSYIQNNIEDVYTGKYQYETKKINVKVFQKCLVYMYHHDRDNFDSTLSGMVEHRSRSISTEFINQLKGYNSEINTSSIQKSKSNLFMSSYDTAKFISDTLAYIHGLLVNEIENARSFFTFDNESDENVISKDELDAMINDIVMKIVAGLNNPLKGAIESILRQEVRLSSLVSSYELIELYSNMFMKLLYHDNEDIRKEGLLYTMKYLESETQDRIFSLIELKFKNLQVETINENLNTSDSDYIPDWMVDWCAVIDELFNDYTSGKNLDDNEKYILGLDDTKWDSLLELLIMKPVELVRKFQKDSKVDKKESLIWGLNCLDYFYDKVDINPFLSSKAPALRSEIEDDTERLTELEFNGLLESSGLYDIFNLVNMIFRIDDEYFDVAYYQPILENRLFNIDTFISANAKLEHFLSTYINQNELNGLISPTIFNKVFLDSATKYIDFYKKLCLIIKEYLRDENGNEVNVFQWNEMTIATLLGVEDHYQGKE